MCQHSTAQAQYCYCTVPATQTGSSNTHVTHWCLKGECERDLVPPPVLVVPLAIITKKFLVKKKKKRLIKEYMYSTRVVTVTLPILRMYGCQNWQCSAGDSPEPTAKKCKKTTYEKITNDGVYVENLDPTGLRN